MVWICFGPNDVEVPQRRSVKDRNEPHVTLQYNVPEASVQHLDGMQVPVKMLADCWNNDIQAVKVSLPDDVYCQNNHPHITISMEPGIRPVASNEMLAGPHEEYEHRVVVIGKIKIIPLK